MISREVRKAIAELPGLTVKPWRDGDPRCHCSPCDLCGQCFPTMRLAEHERECEAAVLKAVRAARVKPDTMTPIELLAWLAAYASNHPRDLMGERRHGMELPTYWAACAVFALRGAGEPTQEQIDELLAEARARSAEGEKP